MNNYKISILFLIHKVGINKQGKCPLRCRITYKKKRKIFSTGQFINPNYWNSSLQKAKPPSKENNIINAQLSLISQKINEAFLMLQILPNEFDVVDVYRKYRGEDTKEEVTILGAYDLHNEKMKKLIGVDFNKLSWSRYVESRRKVAEFIKSKYKKSDVKLNQLDLKFIKNLEFYWKTKKNLRQATIYRSMQRVKKVIQFAIDENYLQSNPFSLYKNKKYKGAIVYLTEPGVVTFTRTQNLRLFVATPSGNNYDSETGTFSFNEDAMTMTFPEGVSLTFVQKVVFINDNVVEFEETGVSNENAYDGVYYRDGALSYEGVVEQLPASTQLHVVEFKTGTLDSWVSVSLTTKLTFGDGTKSTINSNFDSTQNVINVEIPLNTANFEIDFYIEDSSQAEMRFYNSVDDTTIKQETISQQSYQYQYSF